MWESITGFVNDQLGPIEILLSLGAFVFSLGAFWSVTVGRRRRQKRNFESVRKNPGKRPAILVVDLNKDVDILNSVENFRGQVPELADLPIYLVHWSERARITPEDMVALVGKIREKKAEVSDYGADVLHLFYAGPNAAAAVLGAEFRNTCRVLVYQYNQATYVNWGPLEHHLDE